MVPVIKKPSPKSYNHCTYTIYTFLLIKQSSFEEPLQSQVGGLTVVNLSRQVKSVVRDEGQGREGINLVSDFPHLIFLQLELVHVTGPAHTSLSRS